MHGNIPQLGNFQGFQTKKKEKKIVKLREQLIGTFEGDA